MNWDYAFIFMQSNLIEVLFYYLIYRNKMSFLQILGLVTLANSITHPIVFFCFMASPDFTYLQGILWAESFAIIAETGMHSLSSQLMFGRAVTAATLANLVSWQLSPIFTYYLFY